MRTQNFFNLGQKLADWLCRHAFWSRFVLLRLPKGMSMPKAVFSIAPVEPPRCPDQGKVAAPTR